MRKKTLKATERILCLTPTTGKAGTRIEKWKYDAVRRAIRRVVPKNSSGIAFAELSQLVAESLNPKEKAKLGSIVWYTVTVKLNLEVIGELERIPNSRPQRIRLAK